MKTNFFTILLISLNISLWAQQNTNSITKTTSSESSEYSISVSDSDRNYNETRSVSISETEAEYKLKAEFPAARTAAIKEVIIDEFGNESLQNKGGGLIWELVSRNDKIYRIELKPGKVRMELLKEQASINLTQKFLMSGQEIKKLLAVENNQKSEALKLQSVRLQKEAKLMHQEAERLEKQKEQLISNDQIKALKLNADRLQKQVDSLQLELKKLKQKS
jgi:hypothetical protein